MRIKCKYKPLLFDIAMNAYFAYSMGTWRRKNDSVQKKKNIFIVFTRHPKKDFLRITVSHVTVGDDDQHEKKVI